MSANVTVLKDELGLGREYRKAERKANVGDLIAFDGHSLGLGITAEKAYVVTGEDCDGAEFFDDDGDKRWKAHIPGRSYVLEPTDIVHVNGERFRMVDREAMGGERIVTLSKCTPYFQSGDVGTVYRTYGSRGVYADFNGNNHVYEDGKWYVSAEKYRVLEPLTPAQQAQVSEQQAQIDGLTETVANLARRLSEAETQLRVAREDIVLIEDGVSYDIAGLKKEVGELRHAYAPDVFPDEPEAVEEPVVSKTSTREEIIEKAKADVAELVDKMRNHERQLGGNFTFYWHVTAPDFRINRKKRTVAVLIRDISNGKILERAVSKCAPNDCFNVHIGMAIALRRALGLDIPVEYVNAPQPDEVRVGDVVRYPSGRVSKVVMQRPFGDDQYTNFSVAEECFNRGDAKILDDSRDGRYGEVYSV